MDQLITGGIKEVFGISESNKKIKIAILVVLVLISFMLLVLLYKFPATSLIGTIFSFIGIGAVVLIQIYTIIQSTQI